MELKQLCEAMQISEELLLTHRDKRPETVVFRQAAAYFFRSCGYTYTRIGKLLNRDHVSILHSVRVFAGYLETEDKIALQVWGRVKPLLP